jgi:acetyl-CoA synthetase
MRDGHYHTGDVGMRDAEGYITYVGRADDVFKASDYRISPFELESVLIEHPAVAEAAVVPSPIRCAGFVPKAFVILAPAMRPTPPPRDIFASCASAGGYKRSAASSSATCPRPSPARSAASSCARSSSAGGKTPVTLER